MPLTFTGRHVALDNDEVPSLWDIAVGLSRMPRFAGQTNRWWSVLDHSLFCDDLGRAHAAEPLTRIAILLHDAHESLTGDVPTPLKPFDLKEIQSKLDHRIAEAYMPGGYGAYILEHSMVRAMDQEALAAEAYRFLPHSRLRLSQHFKVPTSYGVQTLTRYMDQRYAARPPFSTQPQDSHPAVTEFMARIAEARAAVAPVSVGRRRNRDRVPGSLRDAHASPYGVWTNRGETLGRVLDAWEARVSRNNP